MTDFTEEAPKPESIADILREIEDDVSGLEFEDDSEAQFEAEPEPVDKELAASITGIVMMGGNVICERLGVKRITLEEAAAIGQAAAGVARFYPIRTDPKTMAWMGLIGAVGMVALPRAMEIKERGKALPVPETEPDITARTVTQTPKPNYFGSET